MLEYIGTARANLAWLAWREGDVSRAEEEGRAALTTWQQLPAGFASCSLQWTALWALMAVALAQGHTAEACGYVPLLLETTQQRLPDTLTAEVEEAVQAWERGESESARISLDRALALAQESGYL